jgi:hypothetical protein
MRCVHPGNGDRPTLLLDATQLELTSSEWRSLERSVWWVTSGGRSFPASIVQSHDGHRSLRYDTGCMKPAATVFVESQHVFEEAIEMASPVAVGWEPDDLLILDNRRVLHARAAGSDDDRGVRHLQRVLVR